MATTEKDNAATAAATATTRNESPGRGAAGESRDAALDAVSGISEEEQREILVQIDGIAEKNRQALSSGAETGEALTKRLNARKNGGLFPVLVNVFAATLLAGGFFALYSFQSAADVQAREGTRVFSTMERELIEYIRRQTGRLLAEKDHEIYMILMSLNDIEAQLSGLLAIGGALTPEQRLLQDQLMAMQEERFAALSSAREERSHILEYARSQEARVQAMLDERTREFVGDADAEPDEARDELARLAHEQVQAAAVEAQIAAFFANVHSQVAETRFDDAEQTLATLREFLDTPAFQGLRAIQARRDIYARAVDVLEVLLEEHRLVYAAMRAGGTPLADGEIRRLLEEVAALERTVEDMETTINALGEGEPGTLELIGLRNTVVSLEEANAALNLRVSSLETTNNALSSQMTALQNMNSPGQWGAIATADQLQIARLNLEISARDNTIRELREQSAEQQRTIDRIEEVLQTFGLAPFR